MLSLCFAVPNEDTNLTAVDLSSSIHAPLAGCDKAEQLAGLESWEFQSTHPLRGATRCVRIMGTITMKMAARKDTQT